YYSGLYYQILAGQEDIQLIRIFAEAIRDINENKIAIYQSELQSIDSLMGSIYKVETGIIERFYSFFGFNDYFSLVSKWFYLKRMIEERNRFSCGEGSLLFLELRKLKFPKAKDALSKDQRLLLIRICDQYIKHTKQSLEAELANEHPVIKPVSGRIRELLAEEPLGTKLNVEEG
ncbi:MAG TPA: heptaprenyl diphosphate synthase component 1, partial [Chondromyces sp.]|nr:heptaprenyl diphosphate synthase component 1 [Chondromyces sp.]